MLKKKLLVLCLVVCSMLLKAQQDISMYTINNTFQSVYSNPAYLPKSNIHVGLPVLSSVYFRISNNGFKLGDAVDLKNDGINVDFNTILNALADKNVVAFNVNPDLFSFGVRVKSSYFHVSVTEKVGINFVYPKALTKIFNQGNAQNNGERIGLDDLSFNLFQYREIAFGGSTSIGDKLRIGGRVKFLSGIYNITTKTTQLGIRVDETNNKTYIDGQIEAYTAGLNDFSNISENFLSLGNKNGTGLGLDLGAEFQVNERINVSASLTDLGAITWKQNTVQYKTDNFEFEYDGVDFYDFVNGNSDGSTFQNFVDSLKAELEENAQRNVKYSTPLAPQLTAGIRFSLNKKNEIGAVARSEFYQNGTLNPSFSAFHVLTLGHRLSTSTSISYINRSINFGAGVSARFGPVQIFTVADSFLAIINPENSRGAQFRFGINLDFGGKNMSNRITGSETVAAPVTP